MGHCTGVVVVGGTVELIGYTSFEAVAVKKGLEVAVLNAENVEAGTAGAGVGVGGAGAGGAVVGVGIGVVALLCLSAYSFNCMICC